MSESDRSVLLQRIADEIHAAFPQAEISDGSAIDPVTRSVYFHVQMPGSLRVIEVTERFCDVDGGVETALPMLEGWNLPDHLRSLPPDRVLIIGTDGVKMEPLSVRPR